MSLKKLVLVFQITDECTYCYDQTACLEFASVAEAELEFEIACEASHKLSIGDKYVPNVHLFTFAGKQFSSTFFFLRNEYQAPRFYELDAWFESNKSSSIT